MLTPKAFTKWSTPSKPQPRWGHEHHTFAEVLVQNCTNQTKALQKIDHDASVFLHPLDFLTAVCPLFLLLATKPNSEWESGREKTTQIVTTCLRKWLRLELLPVSAIAQILVKSAGLPSLICQKSRNMKCTEKEFGLSSQSPFPHGKPWHSYQNVDPI